MFMDIIILIYTIMKYVHGDNYNNLYSNKITI